MNEQMVIAIVKDAFYYVIITAGPLLLVSLIIGLAISIFQAATSISEQTLTFVPKMLAVFIVSVLILPFIISTLKDYTIELINMIPNLK
jgi:flagellar biosynthesis protein FliQ